MVYRIYVEKKPELANEAAALKADAGEPVSTAPAAAPEGSLGAEDFSANEPYCTVWTNTNKPEYVYKCTAKGFEGVKGRVKPAELSSLGECRPHLVHCFENPIHNLMPFL